MISILSYKLNFKKLKKSKKFCPQFNQKKSLKMNKRIMGTVSFLAIALASGLLVNQFLKQMSVFETLDAFDIEPDEKKEEHF